MHLRHALFGSALVALPAVGFCEPQPLGAIWQSSRGAIVLTECPPGDHDDYCRAIQIRRGPDTVKMGGGYERVTLLWTKEPGRSGPDALVLGDYGGSGGRADLFAVTLRPRPSVRKLSGERFDGVEIGASHGPLQMKLPFDVEFFNGAPHAGAVVVPVPARWTGNDFAVDFGALAARSYSQDELRFRTLAVQQELARWAQDDYPATHLFPPDARDGTPIAALGLIEMMLSGHADQARSLLDRAWPRSWEQTDVLLGGKDEFWAALCAAVVDNPFWRRFGLARLPNARLIEDGATRMVRH